MVTADLNECFELANAYAPEHLCLLVKRSVELFGRCAQRRRRFIGERSFEVLGDYVAGPSHVMPTGGTARSPAR